MTLTLSRGQLTARLYQPPMRPRTRRQPPTIERMDEQRAIETEADPPETPRRSARSPRSDRTFVPAAEVVDAARGRTMVASGTALIASRSLGPLLRLAALHFKVESGQYIGRDDTVARAGFRDLLAGLSNVMEAGCVRAFGDHTGRVADWLVESVPDKQLSLPLLLDGMHPAKEQRVHAVVGSLECTAGPARYVGGVIRQPVSAREAGAAQRLLAGEEGIDSSLSGAVGLAALIRAVQDDRRMPLRERRLPRELSAVVVVTLELTNESGPASAAEKQPARVVSQAEAQSTLANVFVGDSIVQVD